MAQNTQEDGRKQPAVARALLMGLKEAHLFKSNLSPHFKSRKNLLTFDPVISYLSEAN